MKSNSIRKVVFTLLLLLTMVGMSQAQGSRAFMSFQGVYSNASDYTLGDMITYNGSTYVSLVADNLGFIPSSSPTKWAPLLNSGAGGSPGGNANAIQFNQGGAFGGAVINGLVFASSATSPRAALAADVALLFGSTSCGYLKGDGTCSTPSGGSPAAGATYSMQYQAGAGVLAGASFNGLVFLSTTGVPTAATSAQVRSVIGTNIYQPYTPSPGTVSSFSASGWPSWLNPTVTGASSTPALSVVATTLPVSILPPMVASGSSHSAGLVPDPGASAGTTHYLREDGTWTVPPAGSSGSGTLTNLSFGTWPAWLTPSVTNPTTTPVISVSAATIPNSALSTVGGGPNIPTVGAGASAVDDVMTASNTTNQIKDSGVKIPASIIPTSGTAFLQVDTGGVVSSIAGIVQACPGYTCGIQQLNFSPCSTATSLSAPLLNTDTIISLTSTACLSPIGIIAVENNSATEYIAYSGVSGSTLTGLHRAYWGSTTPTSIGSSGSQVAQVNEAFSYSSTVRPYYLVLQTGATYYNPPGNPFYVNNITYGTQATYLAGLTSNSEAIFSVPSSTAYNIDAFFTNPTGPVGSGCTTGDARFGPNTSGSINWDIGASGAICNTAPGLSPNNFYWKPTSSTSPVMQVDVYGNLFVTSYNTISSCTSTTSPAACGANTGGIAQIAAGANTLTINTTAVTSISQIWFTYSVANITPPTNMNSLLQPYISAQTAGTSFTITLPVAPTGNPVNIQWGFRN